MKPPTLYLQDDGVTFSISKPPSMQATFGEHQIQDAERKALDSKSAADHVVAFKAMYRDGDVHGGEFPTMTEEEKHRMWDEINFNCRIEGVKRFVRCEDGKIRRTK